MDNAMPSDRFSPEGPTVLVVGAGFSADLGFPAAVNLLFSLRGRLPIAERRLLEDVLVQQYPRIQVDNAASYPSLDEFLSKLMVLEQRQDRSANGRGVSLSGADDLRSLLMAEMARWFMQRQQVIMQSPPVWLERLRSWVMRYQPSVIAFNWDLVLDRLLYGNTLSPQAYGFGLPAHVPALLKPHGSLNWYEREDPAHCRPDRDTFRIGKGPGDRIMAYRNLDPSCFPPGRSYAPAIFPQAFLRDAGSASFREVDRSCIERMSQARHLVFLGYSVPETDLHARSLFLSGLARRDDSPLPSFLIVDSDARAAERTVAALGKSMSIERLCCSPMAWISDNL
jgi:hypothetical protein